MAWISWHCRRLFTNFFRWLPKLLIAALCCLPFCLLAGSSARVVPAFEQEVFLIFCQKYVSASVVCVCVCVCVSFASISAYTLHVSLRRWFLYAFCVFVVLAMAFMFNDFRSLMCAAWFLLPHTVAFLFRYFCAMRFVFVAGYYLSVSPFSGGTTANDKYTPLKWQFHRLQLYVRLLLAHQSRTVHSLLL